MSMKSDIREGSCYYFENERLEASINNLTNEIKDLEDKVKELQQICFRYAEEAYKFIGWIKFDRDRFDNLFLYATDKYKSIIDSCIADENYKNDLEHRYIIRDIESYYKNKVEKMSKEAEQINAEVMTELNTIDIAEDDTESFEVVEGDPRKEIFDKLSEDDKKLYYDIMNKEFIDNTVNRDFKRLFEETKPKKERKTYKDGLKEAQEEEELRNRWANYDPNTDMGQ